MTTTIVITHQSRLLMHVNIEHVELTSGVNLMDNYDDALDVISSDVKSDILLYMMRYAMKNDYYVRRTFMGLYQKVIKVEFKNE